MDIFLHSWYYSVINWFSWALGYRETFNICDFKDFPCNFFVSMNYCLQIVNFTVRWKYREWLRYQEEIKHLELELKLKWFIVSWVEDSHNNPHGKRIYSALFIIYHISYVHIFQCCMLSILISTTCIFS